PIKVVLDRELRVSEGAKIFSKRSPTLSIVVILKESLRKKSVIEKIKRLSRKGILVISCPGNNNRIDLKAILRELAEFEIAHLLVEGGGDTAAGFVEKGLVDQVLFFIAPKIIGGKEAVTSVEGLGVDRVKKALRLSNIEIGRIGEDILVKGDVQS
ncbi:RibD family protein, partial [Candidatus Omnitrophota bacterium]